MQISSLVSYTYDDGTSEYFIYPRFKIDDIFFTKIFFKPDLGAADKSVQIPKDGLRNLLTLANYITKFPDKHFQIIYEDIDNPEQFNLSAYITNFNGYGSKYGLKFDSTGDIPTTYSTSGFSLYYDSFDGRRFLCHYEHGNSFPTGYQEYNFKTSEYGPLTRVNFFDKKNSSANLIGYSR